MNCAGAAPAGCPRFQEYTARCPEGPLSCSLATRQTVSSTELAELLVEREGVVVTPGIGFGESGEGHFRVALMRSPADRVVEGVERIARVLETL